MAERTIFTIGHSNHPQETFLRLLQENAIAVLVDTRSRPYSRYVPHFNPEALKQTIPAAGMRYVFLGQELGGRPDETSFYDGDGHVLYGKVAESQSFRKGISKLEKAVETLRVAIFCAEENPSHCHRRLLVGRVLAEHGLNVLHIRGDGSIESETALQAQEEAVRGGQQALFAEEIVPVWRSIQSVLPKKGPPSSSEF